MSFKVMEVRKALNPGNYEWNYSIVDVVRLVTGGSDEIKARKYWNKLKSRLQKLETKAVWGAESGIHQIELVTNILNNCHQLKIRGKDDKLHPSDAIAPEMINDLILFIPSRNKRLFERQLSQIIDEIKNPRTIINY
jgi:hypothetical protein